MAKTLPEPSILRQLIDYDPHTGVMVWKPRSKTRPNGMTSGSAGSLGGKPVGYVTKHGHIIVSVNNNKFLAHRIAWAMTYGITDFSEIDHINGDPADNRLINLRVVDHATNQRNLKRRSDNSSGFVGVGLHKQTQKWRAYITLDGKMKSLGLYDSKGEAVQARLVAQKKAGFHPNHGR